MLEWFPQLQEQINGQANPQFNKAFWERATEIFETEMKRFPDGEFRAARKAAKELKIFPTAMKQAQQQGFEAGKKGRTILSPAGGGQGKPAGGGNGTLSREEYRKLSPEERAKKNQEFEKNIIKQ